MTTAAAGIAQELLKQSILVGVLSIGLFFFYKDNKEMIQVYRKETKEEIQGMKDDIRDCNKRNEELVDRQLRKNNEHLERIERFINNRVR
jgi:hypothetical protein